MRRSYREGRLSSEIQKIISDALLYEIRDEDLLGKVIVTQVKATKDGSYATVYVSISGEGASEPVSDEKKLEIFSSLEKAKGFLRKKLGLALKLRHVPDLGFSIDNSLEYGRHIDSVLADINAKAQPTYAQVADIIDSHQTILLFPHQNIDGDALGASVGLAFVLKELGKKVHIVIEESIPENILFLENGLTAFPADLDSNFEDTYDLAILIDNEGGEKRLLPNVLAVCKKAKETLCIDHHITSKGLAGTNLIEPDRSSTCELVFEILNEYVDEIPETSAMAIYMGIVTDTGRFGYSKTTARTHIIAAELIKLGVQPNEINNNLFANDSKQSLLAQALIFSRIEYFYENMCALSYISYAEMQELGAKKDDIEGISERLRSLRGIELGLFLKERKDGTIDVSMRSKDFVNLATLAESLGGGGHARAAGYATKAPIIEAKNTLIEKATEAIQDNNK